MGRVDRAVGFEEEEAKKYKELIIIETIIVIIEAL